MIDFTGRTIGQYRVEEKIHRSPSGTSGMYRAYASLLHRQVVLKILSTALARDLAFVQRFQHEAQALAQLQHPHIVPVYDFGHYAQFDYIVMEYTSGGSLADMIAGKEPMPLERTVAIVSQIAAALVYAHEPPRSVIHRDITPETIVFDAAGAAKLTDFGLAKVSEVSVATVLHRFGTPAYMPPEQVLPIGGVGPWSDIYALGIVTFEMLTGRLPFQGTLSEILDAQPKGPPSIRIFRPELPPAIDDVMSKALNIVPGERYLSAGAFAAALETAAREQARAVGEAVLVPAPVAYATRPDTHHGLPNTAAREHGTPVATLEAIPALVVSSGDQQSVEHHFAGDTTMVPVLVEGSVVDASPLPLPPPTSADTDIRVAQSPLMSSTLLGVAVAVVLVSLLVFVAFLAVQRNTAFQEMPLKSAVVVGVATMPTVMQTVELTKAPTKMPTSVATSAPTVAVIGATAIRVTSVFTADLPIRIALDGRNLADVTSAQLVAPGRASLPLRIEQASNNQVSLVLEAVAEPLAGQRTFAVALNGTTLDTVTVTLQDFSQRLTARGILANYNYTNRIAIDNTSPYTRLHTLPDIASAEVATLRNNDQIELLRTEGDWYLVRISAAREAAQNGAIGWLERWLIDNQGAPPLPTPTSAPPTATAVRSIGFAVRVDVNYEGSGTSGQFTSCVAGKVLNARGRPYVGAVVNVNNGPRNSFTQTTGSDGIYRVCGLGASHWSVVLQRVPGQTLVRQAVGRVYVNGGSQDAIVNFSQR